LEKGETEAILEKAFRFYYCESEDKYLLGHRVQNMYYAEWDDSFGWVWRMSRYLPWGSDGYPSEPVEIDPSEWTRRVAYRIAKR
jgi:hypothetical protein